MSKARISTFSEACMNVWVVNSPSNYIQDINRSSNYGTISFQGSNEFTWNGNSKLIPNIIPRNASHSGKVSVKYFIPSKMKAEWDGILTFNFDSSQGSLEEINFF